MKYYSAVVKMGHCGQGKFISVSVFVKASNIFQAMKKAQSLPAIKHSEMPHSVREITEEEYINGRQSGEYYKFIAANGGKGEVKSERSYDLH